MARYTSTDKRLADDQKLLFGDDGDASIDYDGVTLMMTPGTGKSVGIANIPTSLTGLPEGSIYSDSGTLKIVPGD